jgi:penicillin-binding protein 2
VKREITSRASFSRRAVLIGAAQFGLFGAIATKLYNLQVVQHGKYATLAQANSISERLTAPERGLIWWRFRPTNGLASRPTSPAGRNISRFC